MEQDFGRQAQPASDNPFLKYVGTQDQPRTFLITTPEGKKYKVTGDNAQGALDALKKHLGPAQGTKTGTGTMRVNGPNGIVVNFPEGTDPQTIDRVMRQAMQQHQGAPWEKYAAQKATSGPWQKYAANPTAVSGSPQEPQTSNLAEKGNKGEGPMKPNLYSTLAQGVLMGGADEFGAGVTAPIMALANAVRGEGPTSIGENYDQQLASARATEASTRAAHPIMAPATEIAGALATAPLAAGKVLKGAGMIGKMGRGALAGAAYGGISGFNSGQGINDRLSQGEHGAEVGAFAGGLLPPIARGAGLAYRAGNTIARAATTPIRSLANKETFAAGKVAEAFKRDQLSPGRVASRLQSNQPLKSDLVAADVAGENTGKLLRSAANIPSDARAPLVRGLERRQDKQLTRLEADVGSAFGKPQDFHQTVEALAQNRKQAAQPIFDAAFNTPTPYTPQLQGVLNRPLMKTLVGRAEEAAANRGEKFRHIFINRNGAITRVPDTEGLHRIKMQVDDTIGKLKKREETGLGNVNIRDLTILKNDLMGAIQNPRYKAALKQYSGDSATVNAIDDGFENGLSMEPEQIKRSLSVMSQSEADMWRMGFARKIVNQLRDSGRAGANRAEILYSPKYMSRIQSAFRDTPSGRKFLQELMLERRMARTREAVKGNSTTASQLAEGHEAAAEAENIRQNVHLAGSIGRGDVIGGFLNLVSRAKNSATGMRPEVADKIIELLTSKDPAVVRRAQALVQAEMAKINSRAGRQGQVERLVTAGGLASIPSLANQSGH